MTHRPPNERFRVLAYNFARCGRSLTAMLDCGQGAGVTV